MRRAPRAPIVAFVVLALAAMPRRPEPTRPAGDSPPAARLTVAAWNLKWLNRRDGEGKIPRGERDYARLRRYADELDADIVALQEVDGPEAAARVFDPAVYAFHFTADEGYLQRTGFAWKRTLRALHHPDVIDLALGRTRRGADLEIDLEGTKLRLLSIHLKAGCADDPLDAPTRPCEILRGQLPVLEAWIDERSRERRPFVVLGDFNRVLGPSDAFWMEIDDGEPAGARLLLADPGLPSACWGGAPRSLIDHFVLGGGAERWLVPRSFRQLRYAPGDFPHRKWLSDHCPIALQLTVGGTGGPSVRPEAP